MLCVVLGTSCHDRQTSPADIHPLNEALVDKLVAVGIAPLRSEEAFIYSIVQSIPLNNTTPTLILCPFC